MHTVVMIKTLWQTVQIFACYILTSSEMKAVTVSTWDEFSNFPLGPIKHYLSYLFHSRLDVTVEITCAIFDFNKMDVWCMFIRSSYYMCLMQSAIVMGSYKLWKSIMPVKEVEWLKQHLRKIIIGRIYHLLQFCHRCYHLNLT